MSLPYSVVRPSRRTRAIEITRDCRVQVRAPRRVSAAEIERFVAKNSRWIDEHLARQQRRAAAHPEPDEGERAELIRRAKELLPRRVAYYAELMGLSPAAVTITSARTRFGSCSPQNRLCFSWRLMQYPPEAIDYVVVHELSHIVHKNHSKDFYALVERYLPDWKARRALLKE